MRKEHDVEILKFEHKYVFQMDNNPKHTAKGLKDNKVNALK